MFIENGNRGNHGETEIPARLPGKRKRDQPISPTPKQRPAFSAIGRRPFGVEGTTRVFLGSDFRPRHQIG